ncbi:MAG: hypothetical protein ACFFAN_20655, partial [Promethearchaeota archaeon]
YKNLIYKVSVKDYKEIPSNYFNIEGVINVLIENSIIQESNFWSVSHSEKFPLNFRSIMEGSRIDFSLHYAEIPIFAVIYRGVVTGQFQEERVDEKCFISFINLIKGQPNEFRIYFISRRQVVQLSYKDLIHLGVMNYDASYYSKAKNYFEKANSIETNGKILVYLGLIYLLNDNFQNSLNYLIRAFNIDRKRAFKAFYKIFSSDLNSYELVSNPSYFKQLSTLFLNYKEYWLLLKISSEALKNNQEDLEALNLRRLALEYSDQILAGGDNLDVEFRRIPIFDGFKLPTPAFPIEFEVNDFITLKYYGGETLIYIAGKLFTQCKYLLLELPLKMIENVNEIDSIDEAKERYDASEEHKRSIPRETEFWGHCSNLQAWYENDYDTRVLHRNLAFPLLKKLTEAGDPLAKKVLKDEIAYRFNSGYEPVKTFLIEEGYLKYFNKEELLTLLDSDPSIE